MPKVNGVGISESTQNKQDILKKILEKHLFVVDSIFKKGYNYRDYKNYLYIDATCGNGKYEGINGSPIVFLDALKKVPDLIKYTDCYFIDKRLESLRELQQYIDPQLSERVILKEGEYIVRIPELIDKSHNYFGLIYFDPNGIVDLDFLIELSKKSNMKKIDILFNYNATAFKRKKTILHLEKNFIDYFKDIKKFNWYISKPSGKWQWSFLFGTNSIHLKLPYSCGFNKVDSDEGERILKKINYTKEEYKLHLPNQPSLEDCFNKGEN
jgi:three-Cys-motif partner protein